MDTRGRNAFGLREYAAQSFEASELDHVGGSMGSGSPASVGIAEVLFKW